MAATSSATLIGSTTLASTETPHLKHDAGEPNYHPLTLDEKRGILTKDVSPYGREITVQEYLDHILPPLSKDIDLDKTMKVVEARLVSKSRFQVFEADPAHIPGNEDNVFVRLAKLVRSLVRAAAKPKGKRATLVFHHDGRTTPECTTRETTSRPDSYALLANTKLKTSDGTTFWANMGVVGEVKKAASAENRRDNEKKIVWSLSHCLCDDAARRGSFGFTIENTQMRLWFCSRACILVSEEFNFITQHRITTQFFLSLLYATPEQLGWDPTMKRRSEHELDIVVPMDDGKVRRFRTTEVLSVAAVDLTVGPGTRLFKVLEVGPRNQTFGQPYILKDSWIDHDRPRE
ncbi:hypothetical protein NM688_g2706 [Phlebia brevispora]|uniref:Uncharacterized protein n=1 Tax=Phlebia brevispora TaxID=194682 RepID=A0ACC1T830_9APHY|nr:hypothetical protein NM688_g2706 [Phlebia brevispora]